MGRARSLVPLLALGLSLVACGGDDNQDAPLGGLWLGDHLDFALCDGELRAVQVQDVSCAAVKAGDACSRDAEGALAGAWSVVDGQVSITGPNLEITGHFDGPDHFVGTYTYLDETCCAVTGAIDARHQTSSAGCEASPDVVEPDTVEADDTPSDAPDDVPGETGEPATEAALALVNEARAAAGTGALTLDDRIVQAAQSHAEYVAKHFENYDLTGMSVHDEDETWSGFTGVKFKDRLTHFGYPFTNGWEIIAFYNDPALAVPAWLETLYHRVPIVHPNAHQIGYGGAKVGGARVDVMDFAGTYQPQSDQPVAWPHDGMQGVRPSWSGMEDPRPYLPPQGDPSDPETYEQFGYPSGPVITLEFPFSHDSTASVFELRDAAGALVPTQWLGPKAAGATPNPWTDDKYLIGTHAIIPFDPIASNATFTAHFVGTFDGAPLDKSWSFTTR